MLRIGIAWMAFMNLSGYLNRIGFDGPARADLTTLRALHRAHVNTVPFENLDVQLRRPVTLEIESIYDKIVGCRRGGWCYELNGLMGWALQQIGFDVARLCAGVMRETQGDSQLGNHLCLLVRLDRPYLFDVGFGSSLLEPLALEEGTRLDAPYRVSLCEADEDYWRFTEQAHSAFSYDFKTAPADEALFAAQCQMLQTASDSPFVQNLVAKRRAGPVHLTLRGRVFTRTDAAGSTTSLLSSAADAVACLSDNFDLDVPEVESLWPAICARHEALFKQQVS